MAAVLAALAASVITARAMTVSPTHIELVSTGSRTSAQITVVNSSSGALPIEAVVHRIDLDETGSHRSFPAGDDFLIMPPQALLPPGGSQVFRIRWLGEPVLDASRSYFVMLNQIPVKVTGKSAVQVVVSMAAMVNVAPPKGAPALEVVGTSLVKTAKGQRFAAVTVANRGTVHGLLQHNNIRLEGGSWRETLSPGFIGEKIGIGLVQPGHQRRFVIPIEVPASISQIGARIEPVRQDRNP